MWDTVQCCRSCCWGQGGGVEAEDGDWRGVLLQWCLVTSWPPSLTAASVVPVSLGCPQTRAPQGGFLPSLTRASTLLRSSCSSSGSFLLGLCHLWRPGLPPTPPSYCLCPVTGQGLLFNPSGTSLNLPWPLCICLQTELYMCFFVFLLFLREGSAVLHRLVWNS